MITIVGPPQASTLIFDIASGLKAQGRESVCRILEGGLQQVPNIRGTEILVTAHIACGPEEMDLMPQLRGIVSPLLGYEWIDVEEATRRKIPVVNGEVIQNRESMAEATIMLLLALLYRLHDTEAAARENRPASGIERHMLKGRKVGIVGYGGIARAVIRRLSAWECEFLICTRSAPPEPVDQVRFVPLAELLMQSDAILVLTSLDSGSRRMLGAPQLRLVKRGAVLVNTARGGIIDEAALVEELGSGRIAAAALDVFEEEPLRPDHPLRGLRNVILTPHAIGHTEESRVAVPRIAVANILSLLAGDVPPSCRNPSVARRA